MKHPNSRSERRCNGETYRNRWRFRMSHCWYRTGQVEAAEYWKSNRTWWARKQSFGHGNRCMCNSEKLTKRRKRRRGLDQALLDNIQSWS